jgi:hypothetical protein
MLEWIKRVNLIWVFILLLVFHGLLYYSFGTPNWLLVALIASLVDASIVIVLKFMLTGTAKQKGK